MSNSTTAPAYGSSYGLLGQDYVGLTFGYTDLENGPASVVHSYGFHANRPAPELPNLDASFNYEYSRVSAFGNTAREHDVAIGVTKFLSLAQIKPYLEGNVGWAFLKSNNAKTDSFFYLVGIGAEIQLMPRLALTPYVNYQEAPRLHARGWSYGVKATYRFAQAWSGSVGLELDDDSDIQYKVGVNRHF
jgi:hypothetical protein